MDLINNDEILTFYFILSCLRCIQTKTKCNTNSQRIKYYQKSTLYSTIKCQGIPFLQSRLFPWLECSGHVQLKGPLALRGQGRITFPSMQHSAVQ